MEEKRRELHKAINLYGLLDERVLAISQELDLLIVTEQKKRDLIKGPNRWVTESHFRNSIINNIGGNVNENYIFN